MSHYFNSSYSTNPPTCNSQRNHFKKKKLNNNMIIQGGKIQKRNMKISIIGNSLIWDTAQISLYRIQ